MNVVLFRKVFIYLFLLLVYYSVFIIVDTPIILADEGGYIGNARYFATGKGLIDLRETIYYPGVSLFYSPVFLISDDLNSAYKYIQFINLLIASLVPIFTFKIIEEIYNISISIKTLFVVSGVSFLYSSIFCYVNIAIPEILLTVLFLIIIYFLLKLENKIKNRYILALSVAAGLLFLSHPRTIVILVSLLCFSILIFLKNKKSFSIYLCLIVSFFLLDKYIVNQLVESYLSIVLGEVSKKTSNEFTINTILNIFSNKNNFSSLMVGIVGQLWYLTVASFGLVWIGLIKVLKNIISNHYRYTFLFILLSAVGMLLLSSLFMNGHTRGDHYIYGRYNEFIWVILMSIGTYSFLIDKLSRALMGRLLLFVTILLNLYAFYQAEALQGLIFNHNNILGIYLYSIIFKSYNIYYISLLSTILICTMFFLRKISKASIILYIIYLILNNYMIVNKYYKNNSNGRMHEHEISKFINNNIVGDIVVAYDRKTKSGWHYFNYQLYSPNIKIFRVNSDNISEYLFGYVISGLFDLGDKYKIVSIENHHKQNLFISKKSKYYEQFIESGYVLPGGFPAELPKSAFKYNFSNAEIKKNLINLSLRHTGKEAFWPNLYGVKAAEYSVRIGIQYLNSKFEKVSEGRRELSKSIYPNEVEELTINLPQQCKTEFVKIDLLQEIVAWFESNGNTPLVLSCKAGVYEIFDIARE